MSIVKKIIEHMEEAGGIFSSGNIEAIPYNHWRKDIEWLVLVVEPPSYGAFIPVTALTAKEACSKAIYQYNNMADEDE